MGIMVSGQWVSGITAKELQKEWGISQRSTEAITGESSRRLIAGVALEPGIKEILYTTIQNIGAECAKVNDVIMGMSRPPVNSLLLGLRLKFDIMRYLRGADPVGHSPTDDLSTKTDRELLEMIANSERKPDAKDSNSPNNPGQIRPASADPGKHQAT
jgi:hypothetical protein